MTTDGLKMSMIAKIQATPRSQGSTVIFQIGNADVLIIAPIEEVSFLIELVLIGIANKQQLSRCFHQSETLHWYYQAFGRLVDAPVNRGDRDSDNVAKHSPIRNVAGLNHMDNILGTIHD